MKLKANENTTKKLWNRNFFLFTLQQQKQKITGITNDQTRNKNKHNNKRTFCIFCEVGENDKKKTNYFDFEARLTTTYFVKSARKKFFKKKFHKKKNNLWTKFMKFEKKSKQNKNFNCSVTSFWISNWDEKFPNYFRILVAYECACTCACVIYDA